MWYNLFMKKFLSFSRVPYFADRLILLPGCLSFLTNIILWVVLFSKFGYTQGGEVALLHFNALTGIDFVGGNTEVYKLSGTGLLIFLVNFGLAKIIYTEEKLFSYFLSISCFFLQILLLLDALTLVAINN